MTTRSTILTVFAFVAMTGASASAEGVTKTWVSSTTGNDTGTCQFTSPCKTFAYAITQTLNGGEIDVKDGGSYGPVTITHSVSIVSAGVLAAISVPSGGVGVTINASSSDAVVLQGLVIDGHGVGTDGIDVSTADSVTVENCQIRNLTNDGISVQGSASLLIVTDTEVAAAKAIGILAQTHSTLNRLNLHGNAGPGLETNSVVSLSDSSISGNLVGVMAYGDATVLLSQTTITQNYYFGVEIVGGQVESYGDNDINANQTDLSGTLTPVAKK